MGKIQGFMLKHRVSTVFRFVFRRNRSMARYYRLDPRPACEAKPISRLFSWGHRLKTKAKAICSKNFGPGRGKGKGYMPIGHDPIQEKAVAVPKGHLAVYVGQKDGDFRRVLVPVIYFNHPLFGNLLREAEQEYGFNHPGGITIPCRISEFESVKTRIAAGRASRKLLTWKQPS